MDEQIQEFNRVFAGTATAEIVRGELHVTIGGQMVMIRLPGIVGYAAAHTEQPTGK